MSVQVFPPSVENAKPFSPGVPGIAGGTVKGTLRKPLASFHPDTMFSPFAPTAIEVSLLPNSPLGEGCWGAFTRMFGPTMVVGADESEVKLVEVPKTASADMLLRNSRCATGKLLKLVAWAPRITRGAYAEETNSIANKRRLSFAIFKSLWVELPLKYCRASIVKLKIFQRGSYYFANNTLQSREI